MQVFRAYFQIIKKHRMTILIYLIVFVALSVIITNMGGEQSTPISFSETKYKLAVFNNDGESLTEGLVHYLEENAQIVTIGRSTQDLQDALFYEQADCVVTIPKGFAQSFMEGDSGVQVEKMATAGKPAGIYMDFLINKYLNMAALYEKSMPAATQANIADYVAADLKNTSTVDYQRGSEPAEPSMLPYYFRFLAYSLLAMMMMGVSMVMMSFNEENINNRTLCAPLKPLRMNLQLVLANAVFALATWAIMCVFIFIMCGGVTFDTATILLCVNALIFTFVSLCIGFLAGKFIKNHGVQAAVTNVISLGFSFISGVFVDQELLGKTVQTIGSLTPSYWYVRAEEAIRNATAFNTATMRPVAESMLIQLGFAAAILIVTLAISKQRRKASV